MKALQRQYGEDAPGYGVVQVYRLLMAGHWPEYNKPLPRDLLWSRGSGLQGQLPYRVLETLWGFFSSCLLFL
jgi:hypothetical protein